MDLPLTRIATSLLLLLLGLVAYWFFRPEIYFFGLLGIENPEHAVATGRVALLLKNHFADAVWCAAVFIIAAAMFARGFPRAYPTLLLALPFVSELLQALQLIPGTFDWIDVFIYAALFVVFFHKGTFNMQRTKAHLIGIIAIAVFSGTLVGSGSKPRPYKPAVYESGVFTIQQAKDDIFVKPALRRITRAQKTLAVVLRVPVSGEKVTQEQRQQNTILYNTIDKELARAGYIVRDRALFAKVLDQASLDYSKIGQLTQTDLILELVSFTRETLPQSNYKNENGEAKVSPVPVRFYGHSIEFKVVGVKDNDLIASFTFHSAPCASGCTHRFSTTVSSSLRATEHSIPRDQVFKDFAARLVKQLAS